MAVRNPRNGMQVISKAALNARTCRQAVSKRSGIVAGVHKCQKESEASVLLARSQNAKCDQWLIRMAFAAHPYVPQSSPAPPEQ
jgi:hypothetical protein